MSQRRSIPPPLTPFIRWTMVSPFEGESARWQSSNERWISIASGHGATEGAYLVVDSFGRCEAVGTVEGAIELAKSWRAG